VRCNRVFQCSFHEERAITRPGNLAATILAALALASGSEGWAAEPAAPKAPASAPKACTGLADFAESDCQLSWYGITVSGTIDVGGAWMSHGAPWDSRSPPGASYLIQRQNRSSMWTGAPNAMSQSSIGIKGTEAIGGDISLVFALEAGFDPYSFRLANGPGSMAANASIPLNEQTAYASSSRAGQWYNGQGYVGFSAPTYGTLTVLRQNSLTLDAVTDYDPLGGSYAFSPIGYQGITCGGGNTENCRHSTSLKYRLKVGDIRVAALWQFGGYAQDNSSIGAYQVQAGADIATWGNGVLSFDVIYSYVRDAAGISLGPGITDAGGTPIPPFLPQTLTATISDNEALMLVAKYAVGPLKLYAGYEHIQYMAPSDPQTSFKDIAGDLLCQGCQAFNNTNIVNTAFGVNGLGNKTLQVSWTGAKYAVTEHLDVMLGYYHYDQDSFFGTAAGGPAPCSTAAHSQCAGTFNAISAAIDWRFAPKWDLYGGFMYSQVNDGLANGYIQRNNIDPTVGLRFRF
jgi:predicted porin